MAESAGQPASGPLDADGPMGQHQTNNSMKSSKNNIQGKNNTTSLNSPKSPGTALGENSQLRASQKASEPGKNKDDPNAKSLEKNRSYKIARFCNTMKVYQKFCKLTGASLHHKTDAMYSDAAENSDHHMFKAIDKNKRSMRFK